MTFCIGCCNNLNYLKLAVHSVRKYSHFKDAPFIIFAELCDDGTNEWLKENREKYNLTTLVEINQNFELDGKRIDVLNGQLVETTTSKHIDNDVYIRNDHSIVCGIPNKMIHGIGGGMNLCSKQVKTEFIMFLHADMFVSQDWDLKALEIFKKYPNIPMWVSSQRFQPNLFNEQSRPGTLVFPYEEFGYKHDDFQENYFIQYAAEFSKLNPDIEYEKGEGVSGLIRKTDWDFIGGNDPLFAPAYWEDKDLWFRMQLANYKFVLTSNSVLFHFGSRSDKSNFPDDEIKRSDRSKMYEQQGAKKFFDKWGFWPVHNQHQFDVIPPHIDRSKLQHLIQLKENF